MSNIIQVTNISPSTTLEQLTTLFGFLGEILDIQFYNSDQNQVCFVEFAEQVSVLLALHLNNTVLIDRALIVVPFYKPKIPDRDTALSIISGTNIVTNLNYARSERRDTDRQRDTRVSDRHRDRDREHPTRRRSRSRDRTLLRRSRSRDRGTRSRRSRSRSRESKRRHSRSRSRERSRSKHHRSSRR